MNKTFLINFLIFISHSAALLPKGVNSNENEIINNLSSNFIKVNTLERTMNFLNKRDTSSKTCDTHNDCEFNQICYMRRCFDDISNRVCEEVSMDTTFHRGNCTEPFYCEEGSCKKRIDYNDSCLPSYEYKCSHTQDAHKPKCSNNVCQIKNEEDKNFIKSPKGFLCIIGFGLFLIILFFVILYFVNNVNKKNIEFIRKQSQTNTTTLSYPNMLNPSFERNLYLRSLKESESRMDNTDDSLNKSMTSNKSKSKDSNLTLNSKKNIDSTGNTYSKSPQSISTLINKSFTSSNNLDRKRSQRSSIINTSYCRNSTLGIDNYPGNTSFQEYNFLSNLNLSPTDNKVISTQLNSINSPFSPTSPSSPTSSFSPTSPTSPFSPFSPISPTSPFSPFSPISPISLTSNHYSLPFPNNKSTSFEPSDPNQAQNISMTSVAPLNEPYSLEVSEKIDNQTALSFDDGVIKINNKNENSSLEFKKRIDIEPAEIS